MTKKVLQVLQGNRVDPSPAWMMRQAGRYLPEYRATRQQAGDFLSLCYNSELAAEVTLQPIRRYGFDASILFADILLVPQALGAELWFVTGEGPRLSPIDSKEKFEGLRPADAVHDTLSPIYETLRILTRELPKETTLIGFAGAPWTVATYMIAGRGTPDQAPALAMMQDAPELFDQLMARIEAATIEYLLAQIAAGAEVVKLFDSWAGALKGAAFDRYVTQSAKRIITAIKATHPHVPVIAFPRGAGEKYKGFAAATGADCVALDQGVDADWAAREVQISGPVQGNLDPTLLVKGGEALDREVWRVRDAFRAGPHIFNLGHGITPDADPENVTRMLELLREQKP